MEHKISVWRARSVPRGIVSQLAGMFMGQNSTLHLILGWMEEGLDVPGWVAVSSLDGRAIGWSWVDTDAEIHVFVDPGRRRRGVGTALARRFRGVPGLRATHHDRQSEGFWRALGIPSEYWPDDEFFVWCHVAIPREVPGVPA